jgi:hypothetical protein
MTQSEPVTTCSRHPNVETNLRCASCGVLICPKCLVQTPVGMKCRECGTQRGGVLFTLSPGQAASAIAIGLLFGMVAGWGVDFLGFFMIFLAVAYGTFAGEMILRASGRKRGVRMEAIAGVALAVGAIGGRMAVAALLMRAPGGIHPPLGVLDVIVGLVLPSPIPLVCLVIAIASAVGRIRYI